MRYQLFEIPRVDCTIIVLFQLDFQQNHHSMLFPADSIVYLTPDGDKPLADIDENKVYIIGGLVDESVSKVCDR